MNRLDETDLRRITHEIYAVHAILWGVGFQPDELSVSCRKVNGSGDLVAVVDIDRSGKQFAIIAASTPLAVEDVPRLDAAWKAFLGRRSNLGSYALDLLVKRAHQWTCKSHLLMALTMAGFDLAPPRN